MTISIANHISASVIVCTYNRHKSLQHTLNCLAGQNVSHQWTWEVIVVDNNSSDRTREILQAYQKTQAIPCLRYEFEEKQGLSHARNRGIHSARGEILLFTDDDVCPESDWVQRVLEGMNYYGCDAYGGYIAPVWEAPAPQWLTELFYGFLALRTDTDGPRFVIEESDMPYGANMGFCRSVFERIGVFDSNLGRKGMLLVSGEETDLFNRLVASGGKIMYDPLARVHHNIEAFRTKKQYFRRWRFQTSYNDVQRFGIPGEKRIFGIPPYLFLKLFQATLKAMVGRLYLPGDKAFFQEIIVCHYLGYMCGLYNIRKSVKG